MSIEDRSWYKEDFNRRMGRPTKESGERTYTGKGAAITHGDGERLKNTPSAEAIALAKSALAARKQRKSPAKGIAAMAILIAAAAAFLRYL